MNSIFRYCVSGCMLFIPLAYASAPDEQAPNQTQPQQEQVTTTNPKVSDNCAFPIATHAFDVNPKTSLTQQLLEHHIEQQKATIAACEHNTQQLTQEKNEVQQQNSNLKQENVQLVHERSALQQQLEQYRDTVKSHEQNKAQLMQEKETTLQENSRLQQENTKHTHKIENLKQKANDLKSTAQLHKSYWQTADQLFKNISQHATMLVAQNSALSIRAYRYKIAAYIMTMTSASLALYSCWNGVQRTLNALGARVMSLIKNDKTRKQHKKIEEELLTEEETH